MSGDFESIKYYMAAEKVLNVIFTIEQTMEFLNEYKIKPDEDVRNTLSPILDKMKKWLEVS